MIVPGVNPHWFGFTRPLESAFAIKIERASVAQQHVLMEAGVAGNEPLHDGPPDAAPLILGQHQKVRIINDEVAIRNRVAQAYEPCFIPRRHQRVGIEERLMKDLRFLRR